MKAYLLQVEQYIPYEVSWDSVVSITLNKDIAKKWEESKLGTFLEIEFDKEIFKEDICYPRPRGFKKKLQEINFLLQNNKHLYSMD